MFENISENYLGNTLIGDTRKNAVDFFESLLESGLQLERGTGYWSDKRYWMVKHNDEYICFILINGGEDKTEPNGWVIWVDDDEQNCFAGLSSDERTKETAWKHIDICANCGGCKNPGGYRKTVFGKVFDKVCVTPMKFDNPDNETVGGVKKLVELHCKSSC